MALVLTALLCSLAFAGSAQQDQEKPSKEGPKSKPQLESRAPQAPAKQQGAVFGVNVDLVVMHTSVYDKNGHFVSGLKKDNFKVYEDGIQ